MSKPGKPGPDVPVDSDLLILRDTHARLAAESDGQRCLATQRVMNARIRRLATKAEHIEAHTVDGIFAKLRIFADVRGENLLESIMQDVARIEATARQHP